MQNIQSKDNYSTSKALYIAHKKTPYFGAKSHYHKEIELIFFIKGDGVRIIGDNIDNFRSGQLVLIGSEVPHLFKNHEKEVPDNVDFIVIKFDPIFGKLDLFAPSAFYKLSRFFEMAKRGIQFSNQTTKKVTDKILKLSKSSDLKQITLLLSILNKLSKCEEYALLASEQFSVNSSLQNEARIRNVIDYIDLNYNKDISLEEISNVAHMTKNSFCRYFKSRNGKTVFEFIREYRINISCLMLVNDMNKSISEISYEIGFNSYSTFNRVFKSVKNISPTEYRTKYVKLHFS